MRRPIPFPRVPFVAGESRTPNWGVRVVFIPVKSHDDVLAGEDVAGEELADVAVERTDVPAVQCRRTAVGPVQGPQAGLRIEQPEGEPFERLTVELGREDI